MNKFAKSRGSRSENDKDHLDPAIPQLSMEIPTHWILTRYMGTGCQSIKVTLNDHALLLSTTNQPIVELNDISKICIRPKTKSLKINDSNTTVPLSSTKDQEFFSIVDQKDITHDFAGPRLHCRDFIRCIIGKMQNLGKTPKESLNGFLLEFVNLSDESNQSKAFKSGHKLEDNQSETGYKSRYRPIHSPQSEPNPTIQPMTAASVESPRSIVYKKNIQRLESLINACKIPTVKPMNKEANQQESEEIRRISFTSSGYVTCDEWTDDASRSANGAMQRTRNGSLDAKSWNSLHPELEQCQQDLREEIVQSLYERISELEYDLAELSEKNQTLKCEFDEYKISQQNKYDESEREWKDQNSMLKQKLEKSQEKVITLQRDSKIHIETLGRMKEQKCEIHSQIGKLRHELKQLQCEKDALKPMINAIENEMESRSKSLMIHVRDNMNALKTQLEQSENEKQDLREMVESIQQAMRDKLIYVQELVEKNYNLTEKAESDAHLIKELNDKINLLQSSFKAAVRAQRQKAENTDYGARAWKSGYDDVLKRYRGR